MKELEKPAIEQLIGVYKKFLEEEISQELISKAKDIYDELTPGNTLLSTTVNQAVSRLFSIAYPNVDPNRRVPTKEEIKEIIEELKKKKARIRNRIMD